ncbi:hypothetical protein KM043_005660 [Ampulex compressa]|nr:hypothetical protein KM043_005660 [Ampulex compressa]
MRYRLSPLDFCNDIQGTPGVSEGNVRMKYARFLQKSPEDLEQASRRCVRRKWVVGGREAKEEDEEGPAPPDGGLALSKWKSPESSTRLPQKVNAPQPRTHSRPTQGPSLCEPARGKAHMGSHKQAQVALVGRRLLATNGTRRFENPGGTPGLDPEGRAAKDGGLEELGDDARVEGPGARLVR